MKESILKMISVDHQIKLFCLKDIVNDYDVSRSDSQYFLRNVKKSDSLQFAPHSAMFAIILSRNHFSSAQVSARRTDES